MNINDKKTEKTTLRYKISVSVLRRNAEDVIERIRQAGSVSIPADECIVVEGVVEVDVNDFDTMTDMRNDLDSMTSSTKDEVKIEFMGIVEKDR